ncbi:MAG: hypothetical protein V3R16_08900 [Nitrospirales bacterium]
MKEVELSSILSSLSTASSGIEGCLKIACGLKSFIYHSRFSGREDGAFRVALRVAEAGSVGEAVPVGEFFVDAVDTRPDIGVEIVNPSL